MRPSGKVWRKSLRATKKGIPTGRRQGYQPPTEKQS